MGPCLGTRLTRRGDGVGAPQFLAGLGIVALDETTRGTYATAHSRYENSVGNHRRNDALVALLEVGIFLLPDFLAGLHIKSEHLRIKCLPEQLAVVDRSRAAHKRTATRHTQRSAIVIDRSTPDLATRADIDCKSPVAVHDIHDAVIDGRLREITHVIIGAEAPDGNQPLDVRLVDLLERAIHL